MKKTVLVLAGQPGCGKWTVAAYLAEKYSLPTIMFSQAFRDVLNRLGVEVTRANLSAVSKGLRELFGQDVLGKAVVAEIEKSEYPLSVVEWARRLGDISLLQERYDVRIIYVEASQQTRYDRVILRGQNADDTTKSFEEFCADDLLETEIAIRDFKSQAWKVVENDGRIEDLKQQIDLIIQKLFT